MIAALRPSGAGFRPETPDKRRAVSGRECFEVEFNGLFVLPNCPIGRYLDYLIRSDNLNDYMAVLASPVVPGPDPSCQGALDT